MPLRMGVWMCVWTCGVWRVVCGVRVPIFEGQTLRQLGQMSFAYLIYARAFQIDLQLPSANS